MKNAVALLLALSVLCCSCGDGNLSQELLSQEKMVIKEITFIPEGVCSKQMDISVENDTIRSVVITKGCSGNTQGVSRLVEGMHIDDAIAKLEGITCGDKNTSCPDQLAKALKSMK